MTSEVPGTDDEKPAQPVIVPTREGTIRLGQFLKLADLVDQGSDAKALVAEGDVEVNGQIETRRGRQLVTGDIVVVNGPDGRRGAHVG
jgi:ribosome-associated protein